MKTTFLFFGVLFVLTSFGGSAIAESGKAASKRKSKVEVVEERATDSSDGAFRYGVGVSTYGGDAAVAGPTLSGWIDLNHTYSLQPFFAVNGTSPFTFGLGAIFRGTIHGSQADGFHLGLGFNLGTTAGATGGTTFYTNIFPVGGLHFSLGSHLSNVSLSFDAGAVFHVTPSPFQFMVSPLSALGGASIHYFF